ncbi:hypothetical protein IU500_07065 [Nocardia terpenica]|uniref:hypothetical protein n=1 Tax=Nocardia terpenica TaxID=455432 RepID=UPI00189558BF|nr:hypothetical protein [Nocardia terpenica]MBF6060537.1 hypothetical protein [Nocardia terpenica]MBF6103797.1 hypothetical protein [Nocardia terpenica]MBF6111829.1 hypothetical protein [Nocardia terpenica]MBF6118018.1 hypothetical protein [Nocardia terpenica]MBF6155256.1 hypothetical protein [Nocardia terpenica]
MHRRIVCGALSLGAALAMVSASTGISGADPYITSDPGYDPGSTVEQNTDGYGSTAEHRPDGITILRDPSGHMYATRYPDGTEVAAGGNAIYYPDGSELHKGFSSQMECQSARGYGYILIPNLLPPACDYNDQDGFFYRVPPKNSPPPTGSAGS